MYVGGASSLLPFVSLDLLPTGFRVCAEEEEMSIYASLHEGDVVARNLSSMLHREVVAELERSLDC